MFMVLNMVDTDVAEARRLLEIQMSDSEFGGYPVNATTLIIRAIGRFLLADLLVACN